MISDKLSQAGYIRVHTRLLTHTVIARLLTAMTHATCLFARILRLNYSIDWYVTAVTVVMARIHFQVDETTRVSSPHNWELVCICVHIPVFSTYIAGAWFAVWHSSVPRDRGDFYSLVLRWWKHDLLTCLPQGNIIHVCMHTFSVHAFIHHYLFQQFEMDHFSCLP